MRRQQGFSLIEMMIALTITVALAVGMLTLLGNTRRTDVAQTALEVLQDDERLAITRIIDTMQNAGYFGVTQATLTSTAPSVSAALPASSAYTSATTGVPSIPAMTAGQSLTGTDASGSASAILVARYLSTGADGVLSCAGQSVANVMVSAFSVDSAGNLNCTVFTPGATGTLTLTTVGGSGVIPLASGVKSMTVLYGVCTSTAACVPSGSNGVLSANGYLTAAQVSAGSYWSNVVSVVVTLTFLNPLAGQPGQSATLPPLTQVIPILNQL